MIWLVLLYAVGVYALMVMVGFVWKPKYPTAVFGFMTGPVRLEDGVGGEAYDESAPFKFFFLQEPQMVLNGLRFAITHIQYRSRVGFYLAWPTCFYFWLAFKFQQAKPDPNNPDNLLRVPGTERVLTFRLPGWRWQGGDGRYIPTNSQLGLHYD